MYNPTMHIFPVYAGNNFGLLGWKQSYRIIAIVAPSYDTASGRLLKSPEFMGSLWDGSAVGLTVFRRPEQRWVGRWKV